MKKKLLWGTVVLAVVGGTMAWWNGASVKSHKDLTPPCARIYCPGLGKTVTREEFDKFIQSLIRENPHVCF